MFDNMSSLWPHVQSGRLRALAVSTEQRVAAAPQLPTIAESVPGLVFSAWKGVMVPAATPSGIIGRLHDACVKTLAKPEVRKRLLDLGAEPVGGTPEQFGALIRKETASWAGLVKSTGVQLD